MLFHKNPSKKQFIMAKMGLQKGKTLTKLRKDSKINSETKKHENKGINQ